MKLLYLLLSLMIICLINQQYANADHSNFPKSPKTKQQMLEIVTRVAKNQSQARKQISKDETPSAQEPRKWDRIAFLATFYTWVGLMTLLYVKIKFLPEHPLTSSDALNTL